MKAEGRDSRAEGGGREFKVTVKVRMTVKPVPQIKVTELAVCPLKACAMSPTCVIKISGSTPYLPHMRPRARTHARTHRSVATRHFSLFAFRCLQKSTLLNTG